MEKQIQRRAAAVENDDKLASEMLPVLRRVTNNNVSEALLQGASEDFSFLATFQKGETANHRQGNT